MNHTKTHDAGLWLGLTLWYMTVLALCATASPGDGLFGATLYLLPSIVHAWLYAPAAGFLGWLLLHSVQARLSSSAAQMGWSAAGALLFACVLEWVHARRGDRAPVPAHVGWAGVGVLLAGVLRMFSSRIMVRRATPARGIGFRRAAGLARKGSL